MDIKDKPTHLANQISFATPQNQVFYICTITDAVVVDNSVTTLNNYRRLLKSWIKQATSIYLHVKAAGSADYLDFDINGTESNYLKCRIVGKIKTKLKNSRKVLSFTVEECN